MADAMTIAASGMQAAQVAMTAAASNIVNAASSGPAPATPPSAPPSRSLPGSLLAYDPKSPFANIDLAGAFVDQIEAATAFRANLAVYRAANGMMRSLLRATA